MPQNPEKLQTVKILVSLKSRNIKQMGGGKEIRGHEKPLESKLNQAVPLVSKPDQLDTLSVPRPEVAQPLQDRPIVKSVPPAKPEFRKEKLAQVKPLEEVMISQKTPEVLEPLKKPDKLRPELRREEIVQETVPLEEVTLSQKPRQKPDQRIVQKPVEMVKPLSKPPQQTLEPKVQQEPERIVQLPPNNAEPKILRTPSNNERSSVPDRSDTSGSVDMKSSPSANPTQEFSSSQVENDQSKDADLGISADFGISTDPKPTHTPRPKYPSRARKLGWEGTVILLVEVLSDGTTGEIEIQESSGRSILDDAAIQAIRKWRFAPAQKQGVRVATTVKIPVVFKIEN